MKLRAANPNVGEYCAAELRTSPRNSHAAVWQVENLVEAQFNTINGKLTGIYVVNQRFEHLTVYEL